MTAGEIPLGHGDSGLCPFLVPGDPAQLVSRHPLLPPGRSARAGVQKSSSMLSLPRMACEWSVGASLVPAGHCKCSGAGAGAAGGAKPRTIGAGLGLGSHQAAVCTWSAYGWRPALHGL